MPARVHSSRLILAWAVVCVFAGLAPANTPATIASLEECAASGSALPRTRILADFDGDLRPDVLLGTVDAGNRYQLTLPLTTSSQGVALRTGINPAVPSQFVSARAQDIDDDGDLDIVLTHFGSAVAALRNDGHGVFHRVPIKDYPALCNRSPGNGLFTGHAAVLLPCEALAHDAGIAPDSSWCVRLCRCGHAKHDDCRRVSSASSESSGRSPPITA